MLVEIKPPKFDVELDIAYASTKNFTGQKVYEKPHCFLHEVAAKHLLESIEHAKACGYRLKIFDGFRPKEAQQKLWDHSPDPVFLSHPEKGSPHSRGVAIDLTLLDKNGNELDMGTGFDDFTPKSYHSSKEISETAQKNRKILLGIMTASGWDFYNNEWWHYQLFNPRGYPLLSDNKTNIM